MLEKLRNMEGKCLYLRRLLGPGGIPSDKWSEEKFEILG
jgi:hypothetical protein